MSSEFQFNFLHEGRDEKMTKNPPHLVSRMRIVMKEAKLPRICSTVAEKSSVTLSIGIGFQFLTSTHTAHNTAQKQPRLELEGITVTRRDAQFGLTRYLSTGAQPGIYYRGTRGSWGKEVTSRVQWQSPSGGGLCTDKCASGLYRNISKKYFTIKPIDEWKY